VAYPEARAGDQTADVMVHSKVMIVDDRYVRIGSANICNRSMRTDTECDLTIEAVTAEHRQAIAQIRDRFLQEHCELERPGDAARAQHGGSLLAAVRAMKGEHHRLVEIPDDPNGAVEASQLEQLADPERPIDLAGFIGGGRNSPLRHRKRDIAKIVILLASILLAALLWRYSSLSYIAEPGVLMAFLDSVAASPLAPAVVLLGYVLGGLIGFPVTVLIAVTALSFGAWPGLAYAAIGSIASATVTYGLGFWLGTGSLRRLFGPRLNRIRRAVTSQGILSVTAVRLVPIAPFTVVNLAAGALGISFRDYLIGTILGIAPGLIAMTLLGDRLLRIVHNPSLFHVTILVALLVAWIGLSIGLQILLSHRERRSRER
ncbi:MAG TPA: VTT domain-containing protein, partial [Dongiaceae bacterium]